MTKCPTSGGGAEISGRARRKLDADLAHRGMKKLFHLGHEMSKCLTSGCLLYTSDYAEEGLGVYLGGRRVIKN